LGFGFPRCKGAGCVLGCRPIPVGRPSRAGRKSRAFSTEAVLREQGPLFRPLVTLPLLFHSPSLKITSAFYSSVVISDMIRHATLPSRPRLARLPATSCDKSFRSQTFRTCPSNPFVFCSFHTLPFSVDNAFRLNFFAFNHLRTLSQKHGGGMGFFPFWNSPRACAQRGRGANQHSHLTKSRICDLRTLDLIYPLFFLHVAHSFAQWALHNSFCFKRFLTLSIATGV